ncbi:superoxide dismutase family protein, partial [Pectobacterium brasiliense]
HLGDLPGLVVNADGTSTYPILAPRIKSLSEVKNHALMVHVGGDNYADTPAKLGGGGARMACGVIK